MPAFHIGLSALRTSQFALESVSNNIANANTEGFHRRTVHLESIRSADPLRIPVGNGVDIKYVERVRDQVIENSLMNVISDVGHVDQMLALGRQIESVLANGSDSIGEGLSNLFAEITKLTSSPDEPAQRALVIASAKRVASSLHAASQQIGDLQNGVRFQLAHEVDALNEKMQTLSELNQKIQMLKAQGYEPNTELDHRDALLADISQSIGLTHHQDASGELNLTIGNQAIHQSNRANEFSLSYLPDGQIAVMVDDSDRPLQLTSGRVAALLESYNSMLPGYQSKLDILATELMQKMDALHATGVGTDGSFQQLLGTRSVRDTNVPLAAAGTVFPVQAGELTVSMVDSNGVRRTESIFIDPQLDSLQDVADRLSSIDGLSASVNLDSNRLQVFSQPGYLFDFTGNIETHPNLGTFSGSSLPTFSGLYTGDINQTLRFGIEGSGDVGLSDNLFLNVYNQSGALMNRINIGRGYEAGTTLDVVDGIQLSLSPGSVVDSDEFTTRVTANPDETGVLAALGLNAFFQGVNAMTIDVDPAVASNHKRFASGKSDNAADTENLMRFLTLENYSRLPGDYTFEEYTQELSTEIGVQISSDLALSSSLQSLKLRLEEERDSKSGVDLNEELVYLQEYQKSYEAAVRVIQTADALLDELFQILR